MATVDLYPDNQSARDWFYVNDGSDIFHVPCVRYADDNKYITIQDVGTVDRRDSYYVGEGYVPNMASISSVEVFAVLERTGSSNSYCKFYVRPYGTGAFSYGPINYGVRGTGLVGTGALSRPGGGSWTQEDIEHLEFGVELYQTLATGVWFKVDYMFVRVTYAPVTVPTALFTGTPLAGGAPLAVTFTDQSTGLATSWSWDFGDSSPAGTDQNPVHTYTNPGTYTVALTATNSSGSNTITKTSYVTATSATTDVEANFSASVTSGYNPLTVEFENTSSGTPAPTTWAWNFGDGTTSTEENPSHTFAVAGTYTVALTATRTGGGAGDSSTLTRTGLIVVADGSPLPAISATPTSGVRPLTVAFVGTTTVQPAVTYAWEFGDGSTGNLDEVSHTYVNAGTYTVRLTVNNPSGVRTTTTTITVSAMPPVAAIEGSPLEGTAPLTVNVKNNSTGDISSVSWNFGEGTPSTTSIASHTYTTPGTYTITFTATGPGGATDSETLTVNVVGSEGKYVQFIDELRAHLLEPPSLPIDESFTRFGGITKVVRIIYDRVCRFNLETGLLLKEGTLGAGTDGLYALPSDLVDLKRVEVDGASVDGIDARQEDLVSFLGTAFIRDPLPGGNTIQLVPRANATTVKVIYAYAPAICAIPADGITWTSTFPLPFVFWWLVKYGVLAEMLIQDGEMYDPSRAAKCEELYSLGVNLVKEMMHGRLS
jgi:PKD repeat protein